MSNTQSVASNNQPATELRLAVAFTGGVSLAVWMGGMAREMNLLLAASRQRYGPPVPDTTEQGKVRGLYADLLNLLNMDCGCHFRHECRWYQRRHPGPGECPTFRP